MSGPWLNPEIDATRLTKGNVSERIRDWIKTFRIWAKLNPN